MSSRLDVRATAVIWAQTVLAKHPRIKASEQLDIQNVLVEAVMQEIPLRSLVVGLNDNAGHYKITLKGFRDIMDDVIWGTTFLSPERSKLLRKIGRTYTQLTPTGVIKIIQLHKSQFEDNDDDGGGAALGAESITSADRAKAVQWAQLVISEHGHVKQQDRPYVEAALVEAALQENPLPKALVIGINEVDADNCYNITVAGYHNPLDDIQWINAFHGKHRHPLMDNVSSTYSQLTDQGAVKVIQVNKVKLNNFNEDFTTASVRKITKRV